MIETVSEYINGLEKEGQESVLAFIEFMKEEYPDLTLKISFSMPMWYMGAKMKDGYIGISAAKNHYSIHFSNEEFIKLLKEELPLCKGGKRCININYKDKTSIQVIKNKISTFMEM